MRYGKYGTGTYILSHGRVFINSFPELFLKGTLSPEQGFTNFYSVDIFFFTVNCSTSYKRVIYTVGRYLPYIFFIVLPFAT